MKDDNIVDQAKAYNQRLEDRLTKLEHSVCVVAQAVAQHVLGAQFQTHIYDQKAYNNIISVIADLQKSVIITPKPTLRDNECNDPDPKNGYGWSEKEE